MWYKTRTLDNVVDEFFSVANSMDTFRLPKFSPSTKIKETEDGFTIKLAIPGIDAKEVSVEVDSSKNDLYIEYDGDGNEFVDKFKKTYEIPQIIDLEKIDVTVELGVLMVTLPRKEEASRKKIF